MSEDQPIVKLIRSIVQLADVLEESVNTGAIERANALLFEHFNDRNAWAGLVALSSALSADAVASYLLGAGFDIDEMSYCLAAVQFVAEKRGSDGSNNGSGTKRYHA